MLFGNVPKMLAVFGVLVRLTGCGFAVQLSSAFDAVIVIGAPELRLKIAPSCQRSTMRDMNPDVFARNFRPGPKGSSKVPFERRSCVRW
jgi:hypothetical protein